MQCSLVGKERKGTLFKCLVVLAGRFVKGALFFNGSYTKEETFVNGRYTKGVSFLPKLVYKRVRGKISERNLPVFIFLNNIDTN